MKIATYNVNGINGRLPRVLEWLEEARPDVACLQEIKTADERFPIDAIRGAGYGALWSGQKAYNGVAILARGSDPVEVRRGLPGDPSDLHSRYLEAAVDGILVASIYLPNGNPQPGPKFDYKLAWFAPALKHNQAFASDVSFGHTGAFLVYRDNRRARPRYVGPRRAHMGARQRGAVPGLHEPA